MPERRRAVTGVRTIAPRRGALVACLGALLLAGCSVEPGSFLGYEHPITLPSPSPAPVFGLFAGQGVTGEACEDAVNPDNGCIRLGAIIASDGPFAARDRAALEGARAFWRHVNEDEGGIRVERVGSPTARFDVEIGPTARTENEPDAVLSAFESVEPDVLALATAAGAAAGDEVLAAVQRAGTAAVPLDGWSGWAFDPTLVETGTDTCFQAVDAMDWAAGHVPSGGPLQHVVVVRYRDRYGQDALAGVEYWVHPTGQAQRQDRVPFDPRHHDVIVTPGGDVGPAVDRIVQVAPDVVVVATGPEELAAIATQTAERGWSGLLVGMAPTFTPGLLDDPAVADVLTSRYVRMASVGPITGNAKAYRDARAALGIAADAELHSSPTLPTDDAWLVGWLSQYPLHRAIEAAIESGDLTRAGLRAAIEEVTVTYDGALPEARYHGDPSADVLRRVWVQRPDPDGVLAQTLLADGYVGRSAAHKPFSRACTER